MSRERGLGTLFSYIPFSTVVKVQSDNPEPLCSEGRGQKRFPLPITEQDAARFLKMAHGALDVHTPERLAYPSEHTDWRWRESRTE